MAASDAKEGFLQGGEAKTATAGSGSGRRSYVVAALIAALACILLIAMRRPIFCTCGYVELWHGALDSGNSQHLADWYSLSHVIHGFLFYALARWTMAGRCEGVRLAAAVAVESAWELLENSPIIIDRYRTATIALGYSGDTVVNSMSDIAMMAAGFLFAARAPIRVTVGVGVAFELIALAVIRDNLTLNIVMLTWPVDAIRQWQAAL